MQTTVVKLLDHTCISTMRYENCLKILQISLVLASVSAVSSINLHIFLIVHLQSTLVISSFL